MSRSLRILLAAVVVAGAFAVGYYAFWMPGGNGGDSPVRLYGNVEIREAELAEAVAAADADCLVVASSDK
ncbi:MAG: hypothetical protein ABEJ96_04635, partial [Thiohalorhabdaceae bacterium]